MNGKYIDMDGGDDDEFNDSVWTMQLVRMVMPCLCRDELKASVWSMQVFIMVYAMFEYQSFFL